MDITEAMPLEVIWGMDVHDPSGKLISSQYSKNLVVDVGHSQMLKRLFTSVPTTLFQYLGVGSNNTAAAAANTALGAEITNVSSPAGSLSVRPTMTNMADVTLSDSDVVAFTSVSPYRTRVILKHVFGYSDNNGTTIKESALFSSPTFGSGVMFNRNVFAVPVTKVVVIKVTVTVEIRG